MPPETVPRDAFHEAILKRAFDHAKTVATPDDPRMEHAQHEQLTDEETLAWAVLILNWEIQEANKMPPRSYCTWCVKVLGQANVTPTPLDEIEAHHIACEHSPLVRQIGELKARVASALNE